MKQLLYVLRSRIQKLANWLGYRIERIVDVGDSPIDILDLVIRQLINDRPNLFFLQIGAHDGKSDDPIRKYITKHHWRGILVEPQPEMFAKLAENYRAEEQLIFENAAISGRDGNVPLYRVSSEGMRTADTLRATFNKQLLQKQVGFSTPIEALSVPSITIKSLLAKHKITRIDLLQLDTEGFDFEIIKMFAAANVKPTVIHFEHLLLSSSDRAACNIQLGKQGYRLARNGINTIAYLQQDGD